MASGIKSLPDVLSAVGFVSFLRSVGIQDGATIGLAISGGVDSMALAVTSSHCLNIEANASLNEGFRFRAVAFVVDHGLREGSREEAIITERQLRALGLKAKILTCAWNSGAPLSGHVQESARKMRYEMMLAECSSLRVSALLTAHHADDQAELFLLRLSRCSGVMGLGCMKPRDFAPFQNRPEVLLLRPFLGCLKSQLREVCTAAGQAWVEDPTNATLAYARNRLRFLLEKEPVGLRTHNILRLVEAFQDAGQVVERRADEFTKFCNLKEEAGTVTMDLQKVLAWPCDPTLMHVLSQTLQLVGKRSKPPRSRGVRQLLLALRDFSKGKEYTFSIGRCRVFPVLDKVSSVQRLAFSCSQTSTPQL